MKNPQQPAWLNRSLYPFESHWLTVDGHNLHYVDEGKGPVILFVHGTPEWSFGYRDLISGLRSQHRCLAVDLLGFGLSDKPEHVDYTCAAHSSRLTQFIRSLQLQNITLVANDFGGSIALGYATAHPANIQSIILFNTWAWSLKNDKHYSSPAKMMNTALGKFLYLKMNFPVNVIMPAAYGNKRLLTPEIHQHYKSALPKGSRSAAYAFSKELMNASSWWEKLSRQLNHLSHKPVLIFWGLKDKFIPSYELKKWKSIWPRAIVHEFQDAGHFVQEEKPTEMVALIQKFLSVKNG